MANLRDFCEPGDTYRDLTTGGLAETVTPRRHDTDGQVYLGYFRKDKVLGFVWDGNIEHPIQVTHEMGEQVIDTFELPDLGGLDTIPHTTLFQVFKHACNEFADDYEEDDA